MGDPREKARIRHQRWWLLHLKPDPPPRRRTRPSVHPSKRHADQRVPTSSSANSARPAPRYSRARVRTASRGRRHCRHRPRPALSTGTSITASAAIRSASRSTRAPTTADRAIASIPAAAQMNSASPRPAPSSGRAGASALPRRCFSCCRTSSDRPRPASASASRASAQGRRSSCVQASSSAAVSIAARRSRSACSSPIVLPAQTCRDQRSSAISTPSRPWARVRASPPWDSLIRRRTSFCESA